MDVLHILLIFIHGYVSLFIFSHNIEWELLVHKFLARYSWERCW